MKTGLCRWAALCLAAVALLAGCAGAPALPAAPSPAPTAQTEQQRFDALCEELFRDMVGGDAITLHYTLADPAAYGITPPPPSLGYLWADGDRFSDRAAPHLLRRLRAFDAAQLDGESACTLSVLLWYCEHTVALAGYDLYYDPVSPLFGVQSQLPVMLVEYTLRTPQDVEDYLALLEDMPRYFGLAAQVAGQRAEAGLFMSDHTLDKVLQQARAFLTPPEENYMVTTFPARIEAVEGLTGAERQAYAGRNLEAVAGPVYQAYAQLLDALEALRGSGRNEGGLAGLPAGRQYYELLAQAAVGTDRTVPQMQQTLQSMAAGSLARMRRLAAADEGLAGRYERYQPAAASPDEMLQDLKEKMAGDFPALEGAAYVLKTVDPALQQTLSPAFYMVPPLDDYENNTIYINPASAGRDLYPTLAHEGWPGHLYQSVYFRAQQPSPLRGALGFSGYDEGWATYVELEYAYAYSGRDEALAAFSAANEAAALALYGLVDIGVNYDGWGREQTAAFVEEYFGGQPGLADWLFDVVVEEPADYLKYAVGYAEFLGLRVQAQEALGAAYDPAAFHAFVLGGGPMPFPVLQGRLNEWLAGQTF